MKTLSQNISIQKLALLLLVLTIGLILFLCKDTYWIYASETGIMLAQIYSVAKRRPGESPELHPNEYTVNATAAETVPFGSAIGQENGKVVISTTGIDIPFIGIAKSSTDASNMKEGQYLENDPVACLKAGIINVIAEEAVNDTDTVRLRLVNHASDATKLKGQFCKTADVGKTAVVNGVRFKESIPESGTIALVLSDSTTLAAIDA